MNSSILCYGHALSMEGSIVFFFLIFIQFVTILLLFYVLFFWLEALWDLSFWTRGPTGIPCIEGQSLNHGTVREFPSMGFVRDEILAW